MASKTPLLNRELGILEFNSRVLAQAEDQNTPLLERLRFVCIVSSNMDEFFEIRMSGLKEQLRDTPGLSRSCSFKLKRTAARQPRQQHTRRTYYR